MTVLLERLHASLDSIYELSQVSSEEVEWEVVEIDKVQRYLHATRYRQYFLNLLNFIRVDQPRFRETDLTLNFVHEAQGRRYLRRAGQAVAACTGKSVAKSTSELKNAIALVRHGATLLSQLEQGLISIFAAEEAAKSILTIELPQKKEDEQTDPDMDQAVEEARTEHGAHLSDLALQLDTDIDFKRAARAHRESNHPVPQQQRAENANSKRNIRFVPLADQMSKIEIYVSSNVALTLEHLLISLVKRQRALGQSDQRSRNQLMVDTFADLMVDNPHLRTLLETASGSRVGSNDDAMEFGDGDDGSEALSIGRLPESLSSHIVLQLTLEEYLKLGGVLEKEIETMTQEIDEELHTLALGNRRTYEDSLRKKRKRKLKPDIQRSLCALGSDHDLSPQAAADLVDLATEMTLVVSEPVKGYPLGVGRKSYRANREMRLLLALRDRRCRMPGCRVSVQECETDHIEDWARKFGSTDYGNLHYLCRNHHQHKSNGWLTVESKPELGDGVLQFTDLSDGTSKFSFPEWPLAEPAWALHREYLAKSEEPPF